MRSHLRNPSGFYIYVLFRETGIPFYVGKGREDRWETHEKRAVEGRSHKDNIICRMKAVGKPIPKIKIVEGLTNEKAAELEVLFIKAIGRESSGGPLINQTDGGDGCVGPSEETRQKISKSNKGQKRSIEICAKMSANRKGVRCSDEAIRKSAETRRGGKRSLESRAKMRAAKLGGTLTEEHKAKIRANSPREVGYEITPAVRAKMSAAKRGCKLSAAHKIKIGDALRGRSQPIHPPITEETRARMSLAAKLRSKKQRLLEFG